ncbi:hypothetical protein TWF173_008809 [Orbilia oligospora]|uniref:NADH dehydrogenase [ubiquinone] 1 alpha subcomplex subunit n=2 Tax=Orbilia oligospora TaxID=2813651 RepID=G1XUK4_ARTOA|nr:hypothetical protein AOL_s00215g662 [Orbilia oligospora ATCC 24927]EGX43206.1 hypothetical protein AOL_s00215g662 [Orbilia oligospora ATCC 24927]KAF3283912.1 hypothetical protein TWF970_001080 [Orbilia oligospora]KAF3318070.1 hypothetical protein TWF173_008809 [Orbilia oligospora]
MSTTPNEVSANTNSNFNHVKNVYFLSQRPQRRPATMSWVTRTIRNVWKLGIRDSVYQLATLGDTKVGILVGTDSYGNKYYQNYDEELPLRNRWVIYKNFYGDAAEIEPGWHNWMSYASDNVPNSSVIPNTGYHKWGKNLGYNPTQTRGAYKPYNTVRPKIETWEPQVADRG